jgi:hypothetical protein
LGAGVGAAAGLGVAAAASGSNPWADDEEFGLEKEVEMSFE